jgi:hypothetical protein
MISAIAMVAMLSGCGNSTRSTSPTSIGDTTPPPAVTGMTVLSNGRSKDITLIWDASAAPDVASYEVYFASESQYDLIGSTSSTRMDVPAASSGWTYAVRAKDVSGNASPYTLYTPGEGDL